jgi:hypothetical protein
VWLTFRRVSKGRSLSNRDVISWVDIVVAELAEGFGELAAQALIFLSEFAVSSRGDMEPLPKRFLAGALPGRRWLGGSALTH